MLGPFLKLLRPGDWTKNAFVLIPAVFWLAGDGRVAAGDDLRAQLVRVALTVLAFSMAGSGFYAINDVLDAEEDRRHPTKCRRPVASGAVSPAAATALGAALVLGSLGVAWAVRPGVLAVVAVYVLLQVAYNAKLKRVRLVDVVTVATGFDLRAVAGSMALGIPVSAWLVIVVFALTLFLAFVKRLGDLQAAQLAAEHGGAQGWRSRAGYDSVADLNWLLAVTGSMCMMSYLAYSLSDHTRSLFGVRATGFALLAPLVLIVLHRLYERASAGHADSPVAAVLADRSARVATVLYAFSVVAVLYFPAVGEAIGSIFG